MIPQEVADIAEILLEEFKGMCNLDRETAINIAWKIYNLRKTENA